MAKTATDTTVEEPIFLPLCAIFRRYLKRAGLKFTQERAAILDAVVSKTDVFEADELIDDLRKSDHRASKATIYRTLKHLVDAKIISEVLIDPTKLHYRLSFGKEPKGHLVCVESNKIVEFPIDDLMAIRDKVCQEHGFEPLSMRFVIYGTSPEVRDGEQAEQA